MDKPVTTKVFKSGNSKAVRLPSSFAIEAGAEVTLREERGRYIIEPVERAKRKFAIDKVWGSAEGLALIAPEDRLFKPRYLIAVPEVGEE
ncbi:AbrB/MazE/SpoVT family DNA-binding domain-containing protein [Sphingomonas sp. RT2P30]|uniref:AbrB/MazE/SpoVT family DNA-binding domain-containing protein n=1 Tax=Parasphingomonas halimpatiens TaxID=3096162 RepID=UPI002FC7BBEA